MQSIQNERKGVMQSNNAKAGDTTAMAVPEELAKIQRIQCSQRKADTNCDGFYSVRMTC